MTTRRREPLADVLGPLEAQVMEIIWSHDEVTVRDVHRALLKKRSIAYTTVMTTMGRLADKRLLKRTEDQPAHRYKALLTRDQYARSTVKNVIDWLVNHFRGPAVAYFIDRVEEEDEAVIESLREAIDKQRLRKG